MIVKPIGHLDRTRFGINFKSEDIKCNVKIEKDLFKKVEENKKVK